MREQEQLLALHILSVLGSEAPSQPCPVLPTLQHQGEQRSGVSWLGSWRAVRCPALIHRRWVMGGRPAVGGRPQQRTETLSGSPCSCWDPCTGACGSRLQSSNHMRLWERPHWVWTSLNLCTVGLDRSSSPLAFALCGCHSYEVSFPLIPPLHGGGAQTHFLPGANTEVTPSLHW